MVRGAKLHWDNSSGRSPLEEMGVDDGTEDRLCHMAAAEFPSAPKVGTVENTPLSPETAPETPTETQPDMPEPAKQLGPELRKQISIFVPLSEWKAMRLEAARRRIPMTELCRRWMKPDLTRLLKRHPQAAAKE